MKTLNNYISEKLIINKNSRNNRNDINTGKWEKIDNPEFNIDILAYPEPSEKYGIDGGCISKLCIRSKKDKTMVCNYDRGWDIRPDASIKKLYDEIITKYN